VNRNVTTHNKERAMVITVSGYSDDVVLVEGGDGSLDDEYGYLQGETFLHFDDGTVIECGYGVDDGFFWTFKPIKIGSGTTVVVCPGNYDGEDDMHDQCLKITGNIKRVSRWSSADGPTEDDMEKYFGPFNGAWRQLCADVKQEIIDIILKKS
jgi:hypothetical protein